MSLNESIEVRNKRLLFFANLYHSGFRGLAVGRRIRRIDRRIYESEVRKLSNLKLSYGEKVAIEDAVDRDITKGLLPATSRKDAILGLQAIRLAEKHSHMMKRVERDATRIEIQRSRPEVMEALREASQPEQVRKICDAAFKRERREIRRGVFEEVTVPDWPIETGSQFPFYLSKHAEQFLAAKEEIRFPAKCNRPSTRDDKQLWFFACALAGAVEDISTRRAVNILGSRKRKKVTVPPHPYSLWQRGDFDLSKDLEASLKTLEEQIAADPELLKFLPNV